MDTVDNGSLGHGTHVWPADRVATTVRTPDAACEPTIPVHASRTTRLALAFGQATRVSPPDGRGRMSGIHDKVSGRGRKYRQVPGTTQGSDRGSGSIRYRVLAGQRHVARAGARATAPGS